MEADLLEILKLKDEGFTHQEIAEKLQTTVGKIRYQLYKKRQQDEQMGTLTDTLTEDLTETPTMILTEILTENRTEIPTEQSTVKLTENRTEYPTEIPAEKTTLTETLQPGRIFIADDEVHSRYGEDQLVLLTQNSTSLYAYWEITDDRKRLIEDHFGCAWGVLPKILRIYDITDIHFNGDNAHHYMDVPIHDLSNNWFIHSLGSNRNYCLDFGTRTWDGRFFTILRSNTVHLPPDDVQPWRPHETWTKQQEQEHEESHWAQEFTGYTIHEG